MANPRDFLLNTDYEMDMVVLVKTGVVGAGTTEIAHGLPFTPLVFGSCATQEDFSDSRGFPYLDASNSSDPVRFEVRANRTVLRLINNTGAPIYYRIFGLEPSDSTEKVGPTRDQGGVFLLNTDYNYRKLYKKGYVMLGVPATIQHDLGYLPQIMTWREADDGTTRLSTAPEVTANSSVINFQTSGEGRLHYRIYYDEA